MNNSKKYTKLSGPEALVKGAKDAGAEFYAGYPITPSSEIMHLWSQESTTKDYDFVQMEDEIASIHAVLGASLAGKKSFTATSGPGFSLMQEGLGTAFAMQAPLVVMNAQRQGPSTGMPTIAGQGEILQTQYGTHGDYTSIVFYPNSVEEMYKYTIEAFNASEESLSPSIILADAYLTNLQEYASLENEEVKNRGKQGLTKTDYDRHFTGLTSKEDGEVDTINPEVYKEWIDRRRKKVLEVGDRYYFYETKENTKADTLIISYGITSRIVEEIVEEDNSFSHFRPITLFPIKENVVRNIAKRYKNIVVLEMNEGQYTKEIQNILKRDIKHIRVSNANPLRKDILKELKSL